MSIFQNIIDCRSLTVIGYMAEDALSQATTEAETTALRAIYETNKLDEAWAIAHEQLGNHTKAQELRLFMQTQQARRKLEPLSY